MRLYNAESVEDGALLAQWWWEMQEIGDIEKMFPKRAQTLPQLFKMMDAPTQLMYKKDAQGMWFAAWLSPSLDAAFYGIWIAMRMRNTKSAMAAAVQSYELAFPQFPFVLSVTMQEPLLEQQRALGYTVLAELPESFDGQSAWLTMCKREDFWRIGYPYLMDRMKKARDK